MPIVRLVQSPTGNCRYCGQNAGFLWKQHRPCRDLHSTAIQEMTHLPTQAASAHSFKEVLATSKIGTL